MIPSGLPWELQFNVADVPGLELSVRFDAGHRLLSITISNPGPTEVGVHDISLLAEVGEPATGGVAHLQGRSMGDDALVRRFGAVPDEGYGGTFRESGDYVSRELVAIELPARRAPALVLGSLRPERYHCDIRLRMSNDDEMLEALSLTFALEGRVLATGESLELPPVFIAEGSAGYGLIEQYADRLAAEMGARAPDRAPSGWCSWYHFYDRVTEADVLANLDAATALALPLDYFQVDDGFQSRTGDWLEPNAKFPSGMASLAGHIREAGYRPGIWLAPFLLHEESRALAQNPGFALKTGAGEPLFVETWLGRCAVLDCTLPASREWLRHVVRTVVVEWGYTFLKLDALLFADQLGDQVSYHDRDTTGYANLRAGLQAIREAAGDDVFLLGCTCPFGPAVGLVDAMRVGPDVNTRWDDGTRPSVRHAMRMSLQRNWMHRRLWLNDPDCLVLRDTETSLGEAEVRFLAAAVTLSGGSAVAGDDLQQLSAERAALLRSLLPPPGVAASPQEPADAPVAAVWRARLDESRSLVGVLNWSDESRWVSPGEHLEPGEVAFAPWSGRLLGKGDLLLAPHEGTLWQVTAPSATPRLVGDTGHIDYRGLYQRQVSGRLQLRNDSAFARTVALEVRGRLSLFELAPGEMRWFD